MKAKTKHLADQITTALGPIFRANPDYKTIKEAIALTVARIAQATPDVGNEEEELELIMQIAADALNVFINEEDSFKTRQALLAQGVDDFAKLVEPGSSADYPDNCDQPVAKTAKLFLNKEFRLDPHGVFAEPNPHHTLEAFNGGMGPEAQAEAERFAGQEHLEEIDQVIRAAGGTPEAYDQAKQEAAEAAYQDKFKEDT